jgi:hypothetical protein
VGPEKELEGVGREGNHKIVFGTFMLKQYIMKTSRCSGSAEASKNESVRIENVSSENKNATLKEKPNNVQCNARAHHNGDNTNGY